MKMNTQSLLNLAVSLEELNRAFEQLAANEEGQLQRPHFALPFPLRDD